jgi:hypothetical protein
MSTVPSGFIKAYSSCSNSLIRYIIYSRQTLLILVTLLCCCDGTFLRLAFQFIIYLVTIAEGFKE